MPILSILSTICFHKPQPTTDAYYTYGYTMQPNTINHKKICFS